MMIDIAITITDFDVQGESTLASSVTCAVTSVYTLYLQKKI